MASGGDAVGPAVAPGVAPARVPGSTGLSAGKTPVNPGLSAGKTPVKTPRATPGMRREQRRKCAGSNAGNAPGVAPWGGRAGERGLWRLPTAYEAAPFQISKWARQFAPTPRARSAAAFAPSVPRAKGQSKGHGRRAPKSRRKGMNAARQRAGERARMHTRRVDSRRRRAPVGGWIRADAAHERAQAPLTIGRAKGGGRHARAGAGFAP